MQNQKQISPLFYIIIGIVLVLLIQYATANIKSKDAPAPPSTLESTAPPQNVHDKCYHWQTTAFHEGETICVYGKVLSVDENYDDPSGEYIYQAMFGPNENSFRLVSVGKSLDYYVNQCITVWGMIRNSNSTFPYILYIEGDTEDLRIEIAPEKCE